LPYRRCANCGVLSYLPRSAAGVTCPECGVSSADVADAALRRADLDHRLDALIHLTRELLDTDVALLTEIRDGREVVRRAAGEWPTINSLQGTSLPLDDTFCQRMLDGRIGNHVGDAETDDRVSDLAMARQLGVRAWIGVPIRLSDAQLYVLCCLARESRPDLGQREVRLLLGLAESVRAELQVAPTDQARESEL
jgi:GAF domain-containing protein